MSRVFANRYEVIKQIGKGGMADVYLALDKVLNREVAIKVLKSDLESDATSLERFEREASAATRLIHPNIVEIYDVGEDNDAHFIVMEYVKGHTLKQLIQKRGPIPVKEAVYIIRQLLMALMEAHKNGIIHRDIKPQNVLIKADGTIKMADFGIAQIANAMQLTGDNSVLGSVHYLAPELSQGQQADMQSDIYSIGIVFYELLMGDVPFKADKPVEVAIMHVRETVPDVHKLIPDIPQSVANIILKATAHNKNERYSNVALMLKDLNSCLTSEHINDAPLTFSKNDTPLNKDVQVSKRVKKDLNKKKNDKASRQISALFLTIITLVSILVLLIILFLCGVIDLGKKKTEIPDIVGLSIVEASDILDKDYLSIDYANIERILTDDIPQGEIIEVYPAVGEKVERGSRVKLTVSDGTYEKIADYVGKNIDEVRAELKTKKFIVNAIPVESDEVPGTIVSQSELTAGSKYNPNISNSITFEYSEYISKLIPFGTLGRNANEYAKELYEYGLKYELVAIHYDQMSEEERIRYTATGQIVRIEPQEGTLYTQEADNKIKIYYFE